MKTIRLTIALLFVSCLAIGQDQASEQKVFDGIAKAVKASQHTELSTYFASSIECDILGKEEVYSKPQATQVMKDFFTKYTVKNFSILHKSGNGQIKYIIGTYTSNAGDNFRMTFVVKQEGNNYLVQQIQIKNNDDK